MKVLNLLLVLLACTVWAQGAKATDDYREYQFGRKTTVEVAPVRIDLHSLPTVPTVPVQVPTTQTPTTKSCTPVTHQATHSHETVLDDPSDPGTIGGIPIGDIINYGKQLWDFIVANKPVVDVTTDYANALPEGTKDSSSLGCWSNPVVKTYRTTYKNLLGGTPVDFQYSLVYTYGGAKDGTGRYLANVAVVPYSLNVGWGYTFSAQVVVPSVTNSGTDTAPVAGMMVQVNWKVKTVLKESDDGDTFFVRGDGYLQRGDTN